MRIVFIGTPEFGAIILEHLAKSKYKPCLVITAPDKPVGRKQILSPSPVKITAQLYNIPLIQPENIKDSKVKIQSLTPDLIVVAGYGKILPKEIFEIPKTRTLNIHPSLLPKYRGPSPIQTAILRGDKETGVSIILMTEKVDQGGIVSSINYQVSSKSTYKELSKKLAELGAKLLIETIPKWIKGEIKPKPQDNSKTSYTKIIKKQDGEIDWRRSAQEIERQIRAFHPWPGTFTFWQKDNERLQLKILKAEFLESKNLEKYPPGKTIITSDNKLAVWCRKNLLIIKLLQLEGKKPVDSESFLRGNLDLVGTIL